MPDVSIKDVAELAGVSIATVSRSINHPNKVSIETRSRVETAVRETGYKPNALARNFRRGRTNLITVALPTIGDPFAAGVMRGIRAVASAKGYSVLIEECPLQEMTNDEFDTLFGSKQADGIIVIASIPSSGVEALLAQNGRMLPVVVACETPPELAHMTRVHIDNAAAAEEATQLLIDHGHERIAMIYGLESSPLTVSRVRGFRDAMRQASFEVPDKWLLEGMRTISGGRTSAKILLAQHPRPTAIFCGNDEMAIGCVYEAKALGLTIPDDLSIVGFDDIQFSAVVEPPLTTVSQPMEDIGERVLNRLCALIEGDDDVSNPVNIMPHKLVARQSVTIPPN